jgi:hypothetical protein
MIQEKWVVAATAPDQLTAEMWQQELIYAQIPAMVEPEETSSRRGVPPPPCKVLVPEPLLEQAKEVIGED